MKTFLYGTTALATAGLIVGAAGNASAAAEKIKLGLSGFHQQWMTVVDQDLDDSERNASGASDDTNLVDQKHNSEVCFIGETKLDNGITVGVNVQLEANTDGDQIDESYLYIGTDSLGRLILGDENNAGYLLHVTAPDGGVSIDSGDLVNIRAFETPGASLFDSPLSTTNLRNRDNDSGKITYISPRFAGFQLGASFIPEYEGGGDNNSALTAPASGDLARNNGINNGAAAGLNYKNTFGGFGVQGSFGYQYGDVAADDLTGGDDDIHAWNLGAQVSYAGFSFGGAYHNATGDNGTITGGRANQINGSSWTVGAAYEFGPYTVGLGYMTGTNNRTSGVGGSTRLDQMALSGSYALGPGVKLVGALFAYDYDEEERPAVPVGVDPNTAEDGSENDGYGFVTGIKLSF